MADFLPSEKDHHRRESSGSYSKAEAEHQSRGPSVDQPAGAGAEDLRVFRLGAAIAGNDFQWDTIDGLRDDEKVALRTEVDHKWRANPKKLYGVIVVCVSLPTLICPALGEFTTLPVPV
jgi:hypothetical protein